MTHNGDLITAPPPNTDQADYVAQLEHRVRQLEDAVAQLQDTGPLEERVVDRVTTRLRDLQPPPPPVALTPPPPPPQPERLLVATPVVKAPAPSPFGLLGLLGDSVSELKGMVGMYIDRRYRMRWTGFLLPPILLILIFTSLFWFPGMSWVFAANGVLAALLNVPIVLILGYFLYRLMSWEVRRYRETVANLPPAPRY